ncbi:MAG: hypothetical protein RTU92_10345 [Candidatus Thorarchaeota archaeon]
MYPDIQIKIRSDFGQEKSDEIEAKLETFKVDFLVIYMEDPSSRIIRCILKLAEGDEEKLERYIKTALSDWRDVIYWAEYDREDKRIFDGNKRFTS